MFARFSKLLRGLPTKVYFLSTYFRNIAVPVLLIVRAIAFQDFVILNICLTFKGILGSSCSLLKSPSSSPLVFVLPPAPEGAGSAEWLVCLSLAFFDGQLPPAPPSELAAAVDDEDAFLPSMAKIFLAIEQPILNMAAACLFGY